MKIKIDKCSFCNKKAKNVPFLISAKNAAICSVCIELIISELFSQLAKKLNVKN